MQTCAPRLHVRFATCDRLSRQSEVLRTFGKQSGPRACCQPSSRNPKVEQSLDLDFDLIVTDLAPVDLIVQRAGRLAVLLDEVTPCRGAPGRGWSESTQMLTPARSEGNSPVCPRFNENARRG